MRTLGRTNNTLGYPNLHRSGPGQGNIKREAKGLGVPLSLLGTGARPHSLLFASWVAMPSHLENGFTCYCLNEIEL